jgi:hypothetical protein
MKIIVPLISFQFMFLLTFSQMDSISKDLLETLIREQHPSGTIYYTDRLGDWPLRQIKKLIAGRRFTGPSTATSYDTVYLSVKEKKYLNASVKKLQSYYWKDSLFQNSKRIPEDSMWAHIQRQNRTFYEKHKTDTSETGTNKWIGGMIANANTFQFSPPIYFRNRSICLVYILRLCHSSCGMEELTFFKMENGRFKRWFLLGGGVF